MITARLLWTLAALAGPPGVPGAAPDSLIGPDRAVPFVAQDPLLCGGAAAAMVERYWGTLGVYAEDYAHLVRPEEGGIRTDDLSAELERRGYRVRTVSGRPEVIFEALARRAPAILLIDGGLPTRHYVVLVGADSTNAWIHDPNFGPRRRLARAELLERWEDSGMWALLAAPREGPSSGGGEPDGSARPANEASRRAAAPSADRSAAPPDSTGLAPSISAETGSTAVDSAPAISAEIDSLTVASAMALLRAGEHARARELALARLDGPLARRIAATARFMEGDRDGALDEWNRLGEPVVDLVQIEGTRHTRYHVVEDRIGIEPRGILERRDLELARRRLSALPAVGASRVSYQPLPDGTVQVEAFVAERPRRPGAAGLAAEATRALVQQEVALEAGPFMSAGDRWGVRGGWDAAWPHARASVATAAPPFPGVVELSLEWRREVYGAGVTSEERIRGALGLSEWVSPSVRLGVLAGTERWADGTRMGSLGTSVSVALPDDAALVSASAEGWAGSADPFGRIGVLARAELPSGERRAWRLEAGGALATAEAPRLVWPGAGTGRVRVPLLRAHPLVGDGAIDGAAFGPKLLHATVEHRIFERVGPARFGGAVFVDAARVWPGGGTAARSFVDPGVGAFARHGGREAMVSLARGEGRWVVSARVAGR